MQVIGNIGTHVEKFVSKQGKEYFRFRLAENHNAKPKPGAVPTSAPAEAAASTTKPEATWFYVLAFIEEEAADLLAKGTFVAVTGRLEASPYINKENQPAVRLTILANKVELVKPKERVILEN